ncbi:MAG: hypothetical protein ACFFB2_18030 [Promethearchaeota archaeon]
MKTTDHSLENELEKVIKCLFTLFNSKEVNNYQALFYQNASFVNIDNNNELIMRMLDEFSKSTIETIKEHNIDAD